MIRDQNIEETLLSHVLWNMKTSMIRISFQQAKPSRNKTDFTLIRNYFTRWV